MSLDPYSPNVMFYSHAHGQTYDVIITQLMQEIQSLKNRITHLEMERNGYSLADVHSEEKPVDDQWKHFK